MVKNNSPKHTGEVCISLSLYGDSYFDHYKYPSRCIWLKLSTVNHSVLCINADHSKAQSWSEVASAVEKPPAEQVLQDTEMSARPPHQSCSFSSASTSTPEGISFKGEGTAGARVKAQGPNLNLALFSNLQSTAKKMVNQTSAHVWLHKRILQCYKMFL